MNALTFVWTNDAQRRAVDHHEGPLLVVQVQAVVKTRALTHRIAHLIGGTVLISSNPGGYLH